MEELKWNIEQNEQAIKDQYKKVAESMEKLQECMNAGVYHGYNGNLFVDGHFAEDAAKLATLIARQRALQEALHMVEKQEK